MKEIQGNEGLMADGWLLDGGGGVTGEGGVFRGKCAAQGGSVNPLYRPLPGDAGVCL